MADDSNTVGQSKMAIGFAELDQSDARERDLRDRYQHIQAHINVERARCKLARIANEGFQNLFASLDDIGAIIGADAVFTRQQARHQPRFAATLVLPGCAPLTWLNLLKHDDDESLVDTVIHEAIHATVCVLGRLPRSPQLDEPIAYHGEEVVALVGTNIVLQKIGFRAPVQFVCNKIAVDQCQENLVRLGCNEQFLQARLAEAKIAASFLTDFEIKIAPPTLEEVQARHGGK